MDARPLLPAAGKIPTPRFAPHACGCAAAIAALVLAAGCQMGPNTALMERELRHQEDLIYDLQDQLAHYHEMLADCATENRRLEQRLARQTGTEELPSPAESAPARPTPAPARPSRETEAVPPRELRPPEVELDPGVPPAGSKALPSLQGPALPLPAALRPPPGARSDIRRPAAGAIASASSPESSILVPPTGLSPLEQLPNPLRLVSRDEPVNEPAPERPTQQADLQPSDALSRSTASSASATIPAARRPQWKPYR